MPPSAEIFREVAVSIIERFVYVADDAQYGVDEHWDDLREVAGGRLAGDCEDFAITIANQCAKRGVPLSDLTLHLVQVEDLPDHIVLECAGLIADCNERSLKPKSGRHYFRWISERNLGQAEWVSSR